MRLKALTLAALLAPTVVWLSSAPSPAATTARDLAGVWTSEQDFNPQSPGEGVELARHGNSWSANVANQNVVSQGSSNPSFRFSDGSELHVDARASDITGQWVQPATAITPYRFASPVRFAVVDEGMWSGQIHPLSADVHMTLIVQAAPDGSVSAFVRNPENNDGARLGMRQVVVQGTEIRLVRTGSPDIAGHIANGTLTFSLAGNPGVFSFERAPAQETDPSVRGRIRLSAPLRTGDGWATGTLDDAGLDSAKIAALLALVQQPATSTASPYIQSLQIARHGELVLDQYFNGFSIDRPHDVRSAGKSVTTLLVGRAIEDGAPISPASRIAPLFAQYEPFANPDPRKQAITVADLMTMSSGYACDDNDDASPGNEDTMQSQNAQPDWYKYTLDLPMAHEPGQQATYCSAGINLLGAVVAQESAMPLEDFFYHKFAAPMQFGPYAMWLMPPPRNAAYMAGGDYFLPRDFLKFGELFLEHGQWNGRQIIDDAWLVASTQPRANLNAPGDYGYGWHLLTYKVGGRSIKAINAGGNGGQLLFVFPALDMTVMITAANYGQYPVWQKFVTQLVPDYILAAVK